MTSPRKRGQASGLEVSILVILIGLFIAGYVILLPPEDRAEMLGESLGDTSTTGQSGLTDTILLSESPGLMQPYRTNVQEAKLEPMHLYVKDETETETLAKSLSVSKTLIKDNYKNILFTLDNIDSVKSAKLTFIIDESKGELTAKLNGREIYEGELTPNDLPIELPAAYLKEQNTIELSSESPGWKLFSANYYLLNDVTLITETTTKRTTSTRAFSIDTTDNDVRKATLNYFVNCNKDSEGELTIRLNGKQLFQDEVFCEYLEARSLTLPKEYLKEGINTLDFEIDEGDYNLDELELKVNLEKSRHPQYAFEVSSSTLSKIDGGDVQAQLVIKFPTTSRKSATIHINDKQFNLDTTQREYKRDISGLLETGTNTLRVEPKEKLEIDELQVRLG